MRDSSVWMSIGEVQEIMMTKQPTLGDKRHRSHWRVKLSPKRIKTYMSSTFHQAMVRMGHYLIVRVLGPLPALYVGEGHNRTKLPADEESHLPLEDPENIGELGD